MLSMSRGPPKKACHRASLEVAVGDGGGGSANLFRAPQSQSWPQKVGQWGKVGQSQGCGSTLRVP